jgi:hypothetical protein
MLVPHSLRRIYTLTCDKHSLVSDQISFAGLFVRGKGQEEVGVVKLKGRRAATRGHCPRPGCHGRCSRFLVACSSYAPLYVHTQRMRKIHRHTEADAEMWESKLAIRNWGRAYGFYAPPRIHSRRHIFGAPAPDGLRSERRRFSAPLIPNRTASLADQFLFYEIVCN